MWHNNKSFIFFIFIFTAPVILGNICGNSVVTYFSPRSQSVNLPRIISGWTDYIHQYENKNSSAVFSIAPGYSQSFKANRIAQCLFGSSIESCECPFIRITGSRVEDRQPCDWLADYFGLSTDFNGTVIFQPKVSNFFIDFELHVDFNHVARGVWLRVWAPMVHTKWDLNYSEQCISTSATYIPGYFSDGIINNRDLLDQARDFFQDGKTPTLINNFNLPATPISFEALKAARWGECNSATSLSKNGIADIRCALGWDIIKSPKNHLGLGIIIAGPTGTSPTGCNLFEPIIGNGHHWEVGGVMSGHHTVWCNTTEEEYFDLFIEAHITHLFGSKQRRSFDLCNRPMSRYMLAHKLGVPVSSNLWANEQEGNQENSTQPTAEFKNAYAPVANLTYADVHVSVGIQADLALMAQYSYGNFALDFGYNFWGRSCENITLDCDCPPRLSKEKDTWALKGDSFVYGYYSPSGFGDPLAPVALSATQSKCATIHAGRNGLSLKNIGIDNPQFGRAVQDSENGKNIFNLPIIVEGVTMQTRTSLEPEYINEKDINIQGSQSRGQSHSLFVHLQYNWEHTNSWSHYIGAGAQVEFARTQDRKCSIADCTSPCDTPIIADAVCKLNNNQPPNCSNCCDECSRCALSQWALWIKGGVAFN